MIRTASATCAPLPATAVESPLLRVDGLSVHFPTDAGLVRAVDDVSFDLKRGRRLGVVGESGSGKTTTALAIMRMIKEPGQIVAGTVELAGTNLVGLPIKEVRARRLRQVSYIPQGAMNSLNPILTVGQQIVDGMIDHGETASSGEMDARAREDLVSVGLSASVADMYPHELSGGMKQRVCIAIGIILSPDLLIADEPTSALDVITQRQVMDTLGHAQERLGASLIMIGHDMGLMAQFVDDLIVMKDGKIVEGGEIQTVFSRPSHPYTKMLIGSVPNIDSGGSFLKEPDSVSERQVDRATIGELAAFEGVSKVYGRNWFHRGGVTALAPLNFALADNKPAIISIVGQSGSGKTTMGNMILGLTPPTSGQVRFGGKDTASLRGAELKTFRRDVQTIFQDPFGAFNPFYKVDHALSIPLRRFGISKDRADIYARMERACSLVGLDPDLILGRFAHELSGGQRQRLQVARALMLNPRLIVADEPVSMVDASLRASILQSLYDLKTRHGISIFYITHDLGTAYHVSDYVIVLHRGSLVEAGTPQEVIGDPQHPYTQLLIDSIPWPDPDRRWGSSDGLEVDMERLRALESAPQSLIRSRIPGFDIQTGDPA